MSIKVTLPAAFTRHTDGRKHFDSAAGNLPGLLADIDQTFPALSTQIKGDDGKLPASSTSTSTTKTSASSAAKPTPFRTATRSCSSPPSRAVVPSSFDSSLLPQHVEA